MPRCHSQAVILVENQEVEVCFFAKRKAFPNVYSDLLCSNVVFLLLDDLACNQIPFLAKNAGTISSGARAFVTAAIWSAYMLQSRRVKVTFIK